MDNQEYTVGKKPGVDQDINSLSINDIELILVDQTDLYSDDEIAELKARLSELYKARDAEAKAELKQKIPPVIKCPKCDGQNPSSNQQCQYCSYIFKEKDYYACSNDVSESVEEITDTTENSNRSLYYIAALIPLLGIILGLIYIAKNHDELGKSLIITSIICTIVIVLIYMLFTGTLGDILSNLSSKECYICGDKISGEAIQVGERYYCDYDCYMEDFLFH